MLYVYYTLIFSLCNSGYACPSPGIFIAFHVIIAAYSVSCVISLLGIMKGNFLKGKYEN